ncbi:unnamed protein product [Danaus chrysippus]|uniref:(African queen) hypothetical protein n=1 Tax=Danaus chrysippus TaxID=151541 RepID=A0A8J2W7F4_9NEOP|nr:unnamed protein product [Danaus chrysippus]
MVVDGHVPGGHHRQVPYDGTPCGNGRSEGPPRTTLPHPDTTLLRRRRLKRPARELIPSPLSGATESPAPMAADQDQPPSSRRRLEGSYPAGHLEGGHQPMTDP